VIGIDTNILLRWLVDEDVTGPDTAGQMDLVERAVLGGKETCFANSVVVAETLWVLAYPLKQPKSVLLEIVDRLLHSYNVEVSDRAAMARALEAFRSGKAGFVDHLIGELNAAAGCRTTLTFDKSAAKSSRFTLLV